MNAFPDTSSKCPTLVARHSARLPAFSQELSGSFAVDVAGLGEGWASDTNMLFDSAVVTAAWIREVVVVVVLLTRGRERVGLVLDPSEAELIKAVERWRTRGSMRLVNQARHGEYIPAVLVHVDGMVNNDLMEYGVRQGRAAFALTTSDYSVVEAVVGRLSDTWRTSWATSNLVRLG